LAGYEMIAGSFEGVLVFSFEDQKYKKVTEFGNAPVWLSDSRRLLFNHQGRLYLVDSNTKRAHEVLSVGPYEINSWLFDLSPENRTIVFSLAAIEADIWQMSLE
jgi:hypothetical protein